MHATPADKHEAKVTKYLFPKDRVKNSANYLPSRQLLQPSTNQLTLLLSTLSHDS